LRLPGDRQSPGRLRPGLWQGETEFDEDNLRLGFKPMFDHLKYQGWIKDDSPKWVERHYFQIRQDAAVLEFPDIEPGIIIKVYHETV